MKSRPADRKISARPGANARMTSPANSNPRPTRRVSGICTPAGSDLTQRNVHTSSAVSNTAGMTVENDSVQSAQYTSGMNEPAPRYSQLPVLPLMISNNHQAGTDRMKSRTNPVRKRAHSDVPARRQTTASTTRMQPSHSGKNSRLSRPVKSERPLQACVSFAGNVEHRAP